VDVIDAIKTRRSIRLFKKKDVSPQKIVSILECGVKAPSASNYQPWEFVIVREAAIKNRIGYLGARSLFERKKRKLKDAKKHFSKIAEAPVFIVVACDRNVSPIFWKQDGSAATQNILLAAHAQGLGGVWLGAPVALTKHKTEIKKFLGMPRHYDIISIVALGHSAKAPRTRPMKDFKDKVHFERW
jgi:nitroreductase